MNIYKLTPIYDEIENSRWETSLYKGEMIVRAESEENARNLAVSATIIASKRKKTTSEYFSPWISYPLITKCDLYENKNFLQYGDEEILYPKNLNKKQT